MGVFGDITGVDDVRLERRLRAGREQTFVGRAAELEAFSAALDGTAEQPRLLHVHGPAGIGRTQLIERFARMAEAAGRPVVRMDARTVAPTTGAFVQAVRQALCVERPVLLIDSFERHEENLQDWFRDSFLPWMPEGALVVLAGVRPLRPDWLADPGWNGSLRVLALGALSIGEAAELLRRSGVPADTRAGILEFAGGHPLALTVAAQDAASAGPASSGAWAPTGPVLRVVLDRLVGEVASTARRDALEVCAHAPVTTEHLLREMLPGRDAAELFGWLRRLPYVDAGGAGLVLQPVVREAVDADLRWRDAGAYEHLHRRLRSHLVRRVVEATGDAVLPAIAALAGLTRLHPAPPDPAFGADPARVPVYEGPMDAGDAAALLDAIARTGDAGTVEIARFWLDRRPESFRALRLAGTGDLVGIFASLDLAGSDRSECAADPVAAAARAHCRGTAELRAGETLRIVRFAVGFRTREPRAVAGLLGLRVLAELVRAPAWSCLAGSEAGSDSTFEAFDADSVAVQWQPLVAAGVLQRVGDGVLARDARTMSADAFWERVDRRPGVAGSGSAPGAGPARLVLGRPEFDTAVRDLLRWWRRPDQLGVNPLLCTRLVGDRLEQAAPGADPVEALRAVVSGELRALADEPRAAKPTQAVVVTYLRGTPTQQAAADQLGLPFSTYRRHLVGGVDRLTERLWAREIFGAR